MFPVHCCRQSPEGNVGAEDLLRWHQRRHHHPYASHAWPNDVRSSSHSCRANCNWTMSDWTEDCGPDVVPNDEFSCPALESFDAYCLALRFVCAYAVWTIAIRNCPRRAFQNRNVFPVTIFVHQTNRISGMCPHRPAQWTICANQMGIVCRRCRYHHCADCRYR